MKKLLLLLCLCLLSCSKIPIIQQEITFTQTITKAVITNNTLPDNTYFGVYGYVVPEDDVTTGGYIMKNGKYNNDGTAADGPYYWPKADDTSLSRIDVLFTAYYPWSNSTTMNGDNLVYPVTATASGINCIDVLYTSKASNPQIEAVPLQFHHALSWVQFMAKYDDTSVISANITKITIGSLSTTANMSLDTKNVANPSFGNLDNNINIELTGDDLTTNYADFTKDLIVIPQSGAKTVTIEFDITLAGAPNGNTPTTITYSGLSVTRTINEGNDADNNAYTTSFVSGHKYIYRILVKADGIDFTVQVDGWQDTETYQIWDRTASAYVERFFDKASMLMANRLAIA